MDTEVSRTTASSCAAAASLALLTPGCVAAGTAFAPLTGSARAAEATEDFFPAAGATLTADVFLAEETNLASVTFLVGSFERAPVVA
ncbi:hypothetical protein [Paraburkholderia sp. RAU2J]|uniref:hypothetical protein n=1 Tax=Paraburkholderia sp. RAU2J TaxID=1938810 RepID=UPI001F544CE0|nr:hypothetical protein [Paraburkholderia sp. RAU2J]